MKTQPISAICQWQLNRSETSEVGSEISVGWDEESEAIFIVSRWVHWASDKCLDPAQTWKYQIEMM